MKIKRLYDNLRQKEVIPRNITSLHCSNRDGVIDLIFYTDEHINKPRPIHDYDKIATNDFEIEMEE